MSKRTRRQILAGAGAAAGAAVATSALAPAAAAAPRERWDREADVVCVGAGCAGLTAAVTATAAGASVIVLEKMPMTGGTTMKSAGALWIPANPQMREAGIADERTACLQYMARYAYPRLYTPNSPTLGLSQSQFDLLAAFYDNGAPMVEALHRLGATKLQAFRRPQLEGLAPDYADHLPENKAPRGRCLEPVTGWGSIPGGAALIQDLEGWLQARKVPVLTGHRVTALVQDGGRVTGVVAEAGGKSLRIRARKGVIFGSGGYAHNTELVAMHQPSLYGACALPGSTGDFIAIAGAAGAQMGPLHTAWRSQVVLDEALEHRAVGLGAFVLPGDSMIVVNRYGKRIVNEKRNYNDRTQIHFGFDPGSTEFPNHLTFYIFDGRSLDAFGGDFPIPVDKQQSRFIIEGASLEELGAAIRARLATLADRTGSVTLDAGFEAGLAQSVANFNRYAIAGKDEEFGRGEHAYDAAWHAVFSARREGSTQPANRHPSITMHPFNAQGPYYAFILAAGALDTSGGPAIDARARVLDAHGAAIGGLYGAGNCVASPTFTAYMGAGGTIGPAMTYAYIAALHALGRDSV